MFTIFYNSLLLVWSSLKLNLAQRHLFKSKRSTPMYTLNTLLKLQMFNIVYISILCIFIFRVTMANINEYYQKGFLFERNTYLFKLIKRVTNEGITFILHKYLWCLMRTLCAWFILFPIKHCMRMDGILRKITKTIFYVRTSAQQIQQNIRFVLWFTLNCRACAKVRWMLNVWAKYYIRISRLFFPPKLNDCVHFHAFACWFRQATHKIYIYIERQKITRLQWKMETNTITQWHITYIDR